MTVALLAACQPKEGGESSTGSATDTTDTTAPGSTDPGTTTGEQECTPGDEKFGEGDCETCVCSEAGTWLCNRCDPTGPPIETTDATTGSTGDTDTSGATSGTEGETTSTTSGTTGGDTGGETTGGLALLPSCDDLGEGDMFVIDDAKIAGDELVLTVGYSGGCATHVFTLCLGGVGDDNVALLDVHHNANGDLCEAFFTEEQVFDLTPVQSVGPSPIAIELDGWAAALLYSF